MADVGADFHIAAVRAARRAPTLPTGRMLLLLFGLMSLCLERGVLASIRPALVDAAHDVPKQEPPGKGAAGVPEYRGILRLSYERESLPDAAEDGYAVGLAVGRAFSRNYAEAFAICADRFDGNDVALGADAYLEVWKDASLYLHLQGAPDAEILPEVDAATSLSLPIAGGWAASAGARHLVYRDMRLHPLSAGLARYSRWWYIQSEATALRPEAGLAYSLLARRYLKPPVRGVPGDFMELRIGSGDTILDLLPEVGGPTRILIRRGSYASIRLQRLPLRTSGFAAGIGVRDYEELHARWFLDVALLQRW